MKTQFKYEKPLFKFILFATIFIWIGRNYVNKALHYMISLFLWDKIFRFSICRPYLKNSIVCSKAWIGMLCIVLVIKWHKSSTRVWHFVVRLLSLNIFHAVLFFVNTYGVVCKANNKMKMMSLHWKRWSWE